MTRNSGGTVGTTPAAHDSTAMDGRAGWTVAAWLLLIAASALVLLAPAIYNGFPLIFPDTGAYLSVSYGHRWTLDRSAFYGLFYKPVLMRAEPVAGLWIALVLQVTLISTILSMVVRSVVPAASVLVAFGIVATIAMTTTLPWHSAQLLPDSFAGPVVLLGWHAASRGASRPGTPSLWLGTAALALMHYTFLGLLAATGLASFAVYAAFGSSLTQLTKRFLALVVTLAAAAFAYVAANGIIFDRWSVSPMGSLFLFARLHEDGLVSPWFDRHCGRDAPQPLCEMRDRLPHDSQALLWGGTASPLTARISDRVGKPDSWVWIDMLHQAAVGSLREKPLAFAAASARATGRQLVHFQALDDECPDHCAGPDLISFRPGLGPAIASSRQRRGDMPKPAIRFVTSAVAWLSLALVLPLMEVARRRRDTAALSLLVAILAALCANAFMAGALSDVHDRYQSRLIWLVPFAVLLLAVRWEWSPFGRKPGVDPGKALTEF